jgi:hypothetical protein
LEIIEIITGVLDISALAGLAVYAIWRTEKVWSQYTAEMGDVRRETAEALKNNTEAMTRLCLRLDGK